MSIDSSSFSGVVFSANRTLRDRREILDDQFGRLRRDFLKGVLTDVERGLRSQ